MDQAVFAEMASYALVSIAVTVPLTFALLAVFKRSVVRGMRREGLPATTTPVRPERSAEAVSSAPVSPVTDASLLLPLAVYVLAGIAFVGVFALAVYLQWADLVPATLRAHVTLLAYSFWPYTPPIVIAGWMVLPPGRLRVAYVSAALSVFALVALVSFSGIEGGTLWELLMAMPVPTMAAAMFVTMTARRVRAAAPLVLLLVSGVVIGGSFIFDVVWLSRSMQRLLAFSAGLAGAPLVYQGLKLVGAVLGLAGVYLLLRVTGLAYRRKLLSDQALLMDVMFGWFALFFALEIGWEAPVWALSGIVAFAVYKAVTLVGFGLLGLRTQRFRADILLLRPFSLGRRAERLFDNLSRVWLRFGAIHMIAGPDLVMATVSPPEFLTFLSGGLSRRFIRNTDDLGQHLAGLDLEPDPDGRYRINQLFCNDNVWRDAMRGLAHHSRAILMDLRGFSQQNQGCCFEIAELIHNVPLGKVLFLIDETTDYNFLRWVAEDARVRLPANSPNKSVDIGSRVVVVDGSTRMRAGLLKGLMDSAAA